MGIVQQNNIRYHKIYVEGQGRMTPNPDTVHGLPDTEVDAHRIVVGWYYYYKVSNNNMRLEVEAYSINSSKPRGHGLRVFYDGGRWYSNDYVIY